MHGDSDGALVSLAQEIHLLSVLPAIATRVTRARLDEVDVILPHVSRVFVVADQVERKVVRLSNSLASLACCVGHDIVATSDVVEIDAPKLDVVVLEESHVEDILQAEEVVLVLLHKGVGDPLLGLEIC